MQARKRPQQRQKGHYQYEMGGLTNRTFLRPLENWMVWGEAEGYGMLTCTAMGLYIYVHMHVKTYIDTYTSACVWIYMWEKEKEAINIDKCVSVCLWVCAFSCLCHDYVYSFVHTSGCLYICASLVMPQSNSTYMSTCANLQINLCTWQPWW